MRVDHPSLDAAAYYADRIAEAEAAAKALRERGRGQVGRPYASEAAARAALTKAGAALDDATKGPEHG